MKANKVLTLFGAFFKIGAVTFGGGYAMIPVIQREAGERHQWITGEELLDVVAVAESTPGPIAINAATFVGYKTAGFWGAVSATCGVVLPSFLVISVLSQVISLLQEYQWVRYAFVGIRAGVLALIVRALVGMYRQCPKEKLSYCIMSGAFLGAAVFHIPTVVVILTCACVGIVWTLIAGRCGA